MTGKGFAIKSCLDMADDLLQQRVVNVMPEYKPMATELWLVCPSRQSITPTVRLLRDFFRERTDKVLKELIDSGFVDPKSI
ncbi:transcriptional regulator LysR family [Vibrio astriarenae]|nr:transcriptional regulator LysR family [Vibrio sp. C7]